MRFAVNCLLVVSATAFTTNHIHAFHSKRVILRRDSPKCSPSASLEGGKIQYVTLHTTNVPNSVNFFKTCFGMELMQNNHADSAFLGYLSDEDDCFRINFVGHTGKFDIGNGVSGISIVVPDVQKVVDAVEEQGGSIIVGVNNYTYGASLIPDEDAATQTAVLRAIVADPDSGYTVELLQSEDKVVRPITYIQKVNIRVADIERAIEFYQAMGMSLHRKRSLVPEEPAMTARVSFGETEDASVLLELKYAYGTKAIKLGQYGSQVMFSTSDLETSLTNLPALERIGDAEARIADPDGITVQVADELELLKLSLM